jgi:hypothetical protein
VANEGAHSIFAHTAILARLSDTLVDVNLAIASNIPQLALTFIEVQPVKAIAPVHAGRRSTVIHVNFTVSARITGTTEAGITIDAI